MPHNKCKRYSLYWAATEPPPPVICDLQISITNIDVTPLPTPSGNCDNDTCIEYGYLYNHYVIEDIRNIANTGWHVATWDDSQVVRDYEGTTNLGLKVKEAGTTHWNSGNAGYNSFKLNVRGSGWRNSSSGGIFTEQKVKNYTWLANPPSPNVHGSMTFAYNSTTLTRISGTNPAPLKYGYSIRLVKDSTTLSHGETGTYTGNDGKIYCTICIGTTEWITRDLAETKYRNGDYVTGYTGGVYTPISNAAWAALSTEAMCSYNDLEINAYDPTGNLCDYYCYGALYNYYAISDIRKITSSNTWRVPSHADFQVLTSYIGITFIEVAGVFEGDNVGYKLWTPNGWTTPPIEATDNYNFALTAGGGREFGFFDAGIFGAFWTSDGYEYWADTDEPAPLFYTQLDIGDYFLGCSIRLVRDRLPIESVLADGDFAGYYTGNDGKQYSSVKIGTQVWLTENIEETKYRSGDSILEITDTSTWINAITGALCYYNNEIKYSCKTPIGSEECYVIKDPYKLVWRWDTWNIFKNYKGVDIKDVLSIYDAQIDIITFCENNPYTWHRVTAGITVYLELGKTPEIGDPVYKWGMFDNCTLYLDDTTAVLLLPTDDIFVCHYTSAIIIRIEGGYITQLEELVVNL